MKKVVLKLDLHDDKGKQKAMKAVSGLSGIDSIAMDMKDKKLTVIGEMDPVDVVGKLRRTWRTEIISVGPAKEPEKKKEEPAKKEEPKKDEPPKKEDPKKKEEEAKKKEAEQAAAAAELLKLYKAYNPPPMPAHYPMPPHYYVSAEENPNACVIC